ncbi:hypothetical protein [uncultured Draconibacterium sp.]|uniref:hypothetical protein n=1 Tax=uncultured Draconibacterium sp. TaxID=1573823 RepID=UPI003260DA4C
MVKAPWSSSGRGLQPVRYTPIHPKVWDKLLGIIKDQGYAIVEPYLDKVIDLAFQFKLKNKKVSFIGISNFSTDYKGQYNGNSLNGLPDSLHFEVKQFITYLPKIILPGLTSLLEQSKLAESYEGYFGVDTLIFRDQNKQLKVNPCLEINVRHNMGLLSLYLEKFIHPTQKGRFLTYYDPKKDFASLCNEMKKNYPLQLTNHKIVSGFCPLTAYSAHTKFGAYLLV